MTTESITPAIPAGIPNPPTPPALPSRAPYAVRIIFGFLSRLEGGMLIVNGPDGFKQTYGHEPGGHDARGHAVRITLNDWDVLKACMKSGDIGFAETYMQGRWQCDDIAGLIKLFCHNRAAMDEAVYGSWFSSLMYQIGRAHV